MRVRTFTVNNHVQYVMGNMSNHGLWGSDSAR